MAKSVDGFAYAKDAQIYFKAPETFADILKQGKRYLGERNLLLDTFGKDVLKLHKIPTRTKIMALAKMFVRTPKYSLLAVGLNIFLRIHPYVDELNKKGMWDIATSTKMLRLEGSKNE